MCSIPWDQNPVCIGNGYQYVIDYCHEYIIFDDFGSCSRQFSLTVTARDLIPAARIGLYHVVVHLTLHFGALSGLIDY